MLEKLKKTVQPGSTAPCYVGPGDVECDSCTGRKQKAVKSCLVCLASFCEAHVKPHRTSLAFKTHKLIEASSQLREMICSQHGKLMEIFCRTDQTCLCYLCTMDEHKGHETVSAAAERYQKQKELKDMQGRYQQRLLEKQKALQELKQAVDIFKRSAQAAVEDSERIFTELILSFEKKRSEVTCLIRTHETIQLSKAEKLLARLEREIAGLKRRQTELEDLSHKEDHMNLLKGFQSLCISSGPEDSPRITINPHLSFDGVKKSLSDLKERVEKICMEDFNKICTALAVQMILPSKPNSREDFLHYFQGLTLDPNTTHCSLILSENNRVVSSTGADQQYPDHPDRFTSWSQVFCKEGLPGRCYWEVEWSNPKWWVSISVAYLGIDRKGQHDKCRFGRNDQSWSLECSSTLSFWHNNIETKIPAPGSSKIGVYVDHSAGILSFYSVSDGMTHLHTVNTTFSQPLFAGFGVGGGRAGWGFFWGGFVKVCYPV